VFAYFSQPVSPDHRFPHTSLQFMLDFQLTYSPWNEHCSQNGNDIYSICVCIYIYIYIYIYIRAGCKISDYLDIQSDISCNVRHFAAAKRDPFSILETQDTVKARTCHFHMLLTILKLN
jgi:hypothetical protein